MSQVNAPSFGRAPSFSVQVLPALASSRPLGVATRPASVMNLATIAASSSTFGSGSMGSSVQSGGFSSPASPATPARDGLAA